jgi:hypothetical protein
MARFTYKLFLLKILNFSIGVNSLTCFKQNQLDKNSIKIVSKNSVNEC